MPLRVAYILHRFPYLTETFIMREVYWLRRQGVHVEIFSLLPPIHKVVHEQAKELIEITHYCPYISWDVFKAQLHFLLRSPGRYFKALGNVFRQTYREPGVLLRSLILFPKSIFFARQIDRKQFDHIHAHFVWIDGVAAGVSADLLGTTFTIHPHAFGLFSRNQQSVKRELEHATEIVTISSFHKDYIQNLCPQVHPEKIHVVYCGLETDLLQSSNSEVSQGPVKILSVGRLTEKKGFEYLIAACKVLRDRRIDFQCRIVGGGKLKNRLRTQIEDAGLEEQVQLTGSKSQKEVLELYHEADIFVLPCVIANDGDRDGIPVVLMEAMACEIPVVTTAVTGIPDLVQHERNGLLVAEHDVTELADALVQLIDDEPLRQTLGERGRATILQKFDVKKNAARLASIFRQNAGKQPAETRPNDSQAPPSVSPSIHETSNV